MLQPYVSAGKYDQDLAGEVDALIPELEDLLRAIAGLLVTEKASIQVGSWSDETSTTLSLKVAPEDLGSVIGKQGRTARSLRTILLGAATKQGKRVTLDISEIPRISPNA